MTVEALAWEQAKEERLWWAIANDVAANLEWMIRDVLQHQL